MAERIACNDDVAGSSPAPGSNTNSSNTMSRPLTKTAERAREQALNRHRRQLRIHRIISWFLFLLLAGSNIYHVLENRSLKAGWRTDQAPVGHPYYVVTRGYIGHDKKWRSFDTGQPIEVTHWTTNTVKK